MAAILQTYSNAFIWTENKYVDSNYIEVGSRGYDLQ